VPSGSRPRKASTRSRPEPPSPASPPPPRGPWWTDRLTAYENHQAKCFKVEEVPGSDTQHIAYIAHDLDLFEEVPIANLTSSTIGNVFGFKALKALRLENQRIPAHYLKTFQGPAHGIGMEREYLNKYGRPLLGATVKPKLGLSPRNYGLSSTRPSKAASTSPKDDENINSQPFGRWRDRYVHCVEAVKRAEERTGEIKGHYMNVTAATMEEIYERGPFRQGARVDHHHDRPHHRLHGHPSP